MARLVRNPRTCAYGTVATLGYMPVRHAKCVIHDSSTPHIPVRRRSHSACTRQATLSPPPLTLVRTSRAITLIDAQERRKRFGAEGVKRIRVTGKQTIVVPPTRAPVPGGSAGQMSERQRVVVRPTGTSERRIQGTIVCGLLPGSLNPRAFHQAKRRPQRGDARPKDAANRRHDYWCCLPGCADIRGELTAAASATESSPLRLHRRSGSSAARGAGNR